MKNEPQIVISIPSGALLNGSKNGFIQNNHYATFETVEDAKDWIEKNNSKFSSITTGLPIKMRIDKITKTINK